MKTLISTIVLLSFFHTVYAQSVFTDNTWKKWDNISVPVKGVRTIVPDKETVLFVNSNNFKSKLLSLSSDVNDAETIMLPAPDGTMRSFRIWLDNMMEKGLADKYPNIKTFSGYASDNKAVTAKFDYTEFGFHAMVFDNSGIYFIDPYTDMDEGFYSCYYKEDYKAPVGQMMHCESAEALNEETITNAAPINLRLNGQVIRTFRLALACTGEYAIAVAGPSPTKSAVLSKMITSMNRVNGVYERELAVHMNLVANNDTLIFLDPATDPYSNNSSASSMLSENSGVVNSRIGLSNYDIGHVFSTGAGGQAQKASVCKNSTKAQGVTGRSNPTGDAFDIDYVAHEMGHQLGADHTFNSSMGSCGGGNIVNSSAYEPGSGSTIMAYAGICNSDNLQSHSDDYFHARSLDQIINYLESSSASCAITIPSQNNIPSVPAFTQDFVIPMLTPFELTAPTAIDADHDTLTYCWEQWNKGNYGTSLTATTTSGPIFRSFTPDTSATRVFPKIETVVNGVAFKGEKLPDVDRFLTFRLTVRDIYNGFGSFNFSDDSIHLDVTSAAGPFAVTSPATNVNWLGSTTEAVTWDVSNTNMPPVNCTNVDVYLSVDGGYTYPYLLIANTPNDGSEVITVPNVASTNQARIKVKGTGNVFFNVSPVDFKVTHNTGIKQVSWQNDISIFPVPAHDKLYITSTNNMKLEVHVINAVGQKIFQAPFLKKVEIPVSGWTSGVYYFQLVDAANGERVICPVAVN